MEKLLPLSMFLPSNTPAELGEGDSSPFTNIVDFIKKKTGLCLSKGKVADLRASLSRLLLERSLESLDQLFTILTTPSPESISLLNQMIHRLTTGETYFFRIPSHFKILKEVLIPEIVNRKQKERTIRIWSAGCSTGEEAYSLAILLTEALPDKENWNISILATDINREALEYARQGIYGRWSFREVPIKIIENNFIHKDDKYYLKKKFKEMVTFKPLNLAEDSYPSIFNATNEMDVIFCRNVIIYFTPEATHQVITKLYHSLAEDGFLFVGPAEYSAELYREFTPRVFPEVIVYQKRKKTSDPSFPLTISSHPLPNLRFRNNDQNDLSPSTPLHANLTAGRTLIPRGVAKKETELFREAVELLERGEYNYSMGKFMEVLALNPHNARAYFLLARIATQRNNRADAIRCLMQSMKCDPLLFEAYHLLALLKIEEGNVDEAIALLKKVMYINPHFPLAYYHLGTIYKKQRKEEQAKKMFSQVKELLASSNPNSHIVEGEDISVGQILATVEKEISHLEE